MKKYIFLLFTILLFATTPQAQAPISPLELEVIDMPKQDNSALLSKEMEARKGQKNRPLQFAVAMSTNITPATHGVWETLENGNLQWRVRIQSEDAISLNFGFGKFVMPPTGELTIHSIDKRQSQGPYTPLDNDDHEELWTPIIYAEDVIIQVVIGERYKDELQLRIDYVNHDFYGVGLDLNNNRISGSCNLDVVCGAADGWPQNDNNRDIIRSAAWYTINGTGTCSGALINNTCQDQTPYFLTADHCGVSAANDQTMVVFWLFEHSFCRAPNSAVSGGNGNGPTNVRNNGAIFRADWGNSDFTLVELDDPVNPNALAYFAGWRRDNAAPSSAIAVHHPNLDEKRISYENDPVSPAGNFLRVNDWDIGTTEPGSSGSPLFNQDKQIVGQLCCGGAACGNNQSDDYGWVFRSWNGGNTNDSRLSNWLDPCGTGAVFIGGLDTQGGSACPTEFTAANGNRLVGIENTTIKYESDGDIESTQIVQGTPTVEYDSATLVELLSGFEARASAMFHAFIDGCGNLLNGETEVEEK